MRGLSLSHNAVGSGHPTETEEQATRGGVRREGCDEREHGEEMGLVGGGGRNTSVGHSSRLSSQVRQSVTI